MKGKLVQSAEQIALRPREGWLATSELDLPKQDAASLGFGVERRWAAMRGLTASVRAGYRTGRSDEGILAGASLGFGAAWRGLEADFSWAPGGVFGDLFKYSVLVRLGEDVSAGERASRLPPPSE